MAEWFDIGDSWQKTQGQGGYDLMLLKLTNRNTPSSSGPKPKFFIMSGLHAREYTTAEMALRFAEYLVANYGKDPDVTWMLDTQEFHFLLHSNPDGRKRAETGLSWRKNTDNAFCSNTNTRGIDLNRNFSFLWNTCQGGSCGSNNECSVTYRGPSVSSEPEVQTIQNYLRATFADVRQPPLSSPAPADTPGLMLDVHSFGRLVLWPFANGVKPANNDAYLALGDRLSYYNGHDPRQGSGLYLHDGVSDDFAYGELGVASFTFELGTSFFQDCATFESSIYPGNLRSLLYAAKIVRAPYLLPSGPEAINVSASPTLVAPGTLVQVIGSVDDTRFKKGLKPAQAIAASRYSIDIPPWQNGAVLLPMAAGDGTFNATSESVAASISTTGLSAGRHTVFVQGQDSVGNWGPVSAAFFTVQGAVTPTPTTSPQPTATPFPSPTPTTTPSPTPLPTTTLLPPNTVFADDFETARGWTTNPNNTDTATSGQWTRGTSAPTFYGSAKMQLAPASGLFALATGSQGGSSVGAFDVDSGLTSTRSPSIMLPTVAPGQRLTLKLKYAFGHTANASSTDYFRVRVIGNTTTTLLDLPATATLRSAVWTALTADLSAFAGQTSALVVEAADNAGGSVVEAAIDDVVIQVE